MEQRVGDVPLRFDEEAITDRKALCYYAYSPLFAGTPEERRAALPVERCLRLGLDTDLPATLEPEIDTALEVRTADLEQISRDGEPLGQAGVHLELTATGGSVAAATGVTNASGVFTTTVRLSGDRLTLVIVARTEPGGRELARTTVEAMRVGGCAPTRPVTIGGGTSSAVARVGDAGLEREGSSLVFDATVDDGPDPEGHRASATIHSGGGIDPCTGAASVHGRGLTTGGFARTSLSRSFTVAERVPYTLSWRALGRRTGPPDVRRFALRLNNAAGNIVITRPPVNTTWKEDGRKAGTLAPGTYELVTMNECRASTCSVEWRVHLEVGGPPDMPQFTERPAEIETQTTARFAFAVLEGSLPGRLECSLDRAPFAECTSPVELTGLADDNHVFAVRHVPAFGAPSFAKEERWTVDTKPPAVVFDRAPSGDSNPPDAEITFRAVDPDGTTTNHATFECALDSFVLEDCVSPYAATGLTLGTHRFTVVATDLAGHVSGSKTVIWKVGP